MKTNIRLYLFLTFAVWIDVEFASGQIKSGQTTEKQISVSEMLINTTVKIESLKEISSINETKLNVTVGTAFFLNLKSTN